MSAVKPLDKEITSYLLYLNNDQKRAILSVVKSFANQEDSDDWWDELPASVKKSILKAEKELEAGKGIPHEVVMKKYSKWLTK